MREYNCPDLYNGEDDAKLLVGNFFDLIKNKQYKAEEDKDGNFCIERGDVENGAVECYACLKKIIFKKNGNIDVEMCIGKNKTSHTVNIKCKIRKHGCFDQKKIVWQPFNWKKLNKGSLTKDKILIFLKSSQDSTELIELKNKIINQLATTLNTELKNKNTCMSATKQNLNQNFNENESVNEGVNNSEDSDNGNNNINIIPKFGVNNNNLDDKHITDAENKKHTALNTNKNNKNDTYHNEDNYIARGIRNCLKTINCCDCLSLDTGLSMYWRENNSPFIFK